MTVPVVRRIVVGVDGSEGSAAALRWACREARLRGAEVHAIRAWEAPQRGVASYAWSARVPVQSGGVVAVGDHLRRTVQQMAEPGVVIRAEVAEGLPARVLLDRANGADMLVLGSANHPAMRAAGPVIRACVSHAPCPVVVIGAEPDRPETHAEEAARSEVAQIGAISSAGIQVTPRGWA
jgi:nucleotide-binding universal stress UspA family protein